MDNPHRQDLEFGMRANWCGWVALAILALGMVACGPSRAMDATATATAVPASTTVPSPPTMTPTAAPTPTTAPTPTVTPEPTLRISVLWPERVSPLEPIPVEITFDPPPVDAQLAVSATVLQPNGERYAVFELAPDSASGGSNPAHYVAPEPLRLPLMPASGTWWLVAHVEVPYPLVGFRVRTFIAETPSFRDLAGVLPDGVRIQVPEAFETRIATGGPQAGGRVWGYEGGELGLWWTPGPAEALTLTTARMMVEASRAANAPTGLPPEVAASESLTWQAQPAYRFEERWEDASSVGVVWVIQDDQDWLYVLRLRPAEDGWMPGLLEATADTLSFGD